jgi:hypothetical protein
MVHAPTVTKVVSLLSFFVRRFTVASPHLRYDSTYRVCRHGSYHNSTLRQRRPLQLDLLPRVLRDYKANMAAPPVDQLSCRFPFRRSRSPISRIVGIETISGSLLS